MPETLAWRAYVGCRTTRERAARGEGLRLFRVPARGAWEPLALERGLPNPSYLALDAAAANLYVVHGDGASLSHYALSPGGGVPFRRITHDTLGSNPVHLVLSRCGRWLLVANYASGGLALYAVAADGGLGAPVKAAELVGTPGPHPEQVGGSHPHQLVFDASGRWLLVPDKGFDRVFVFAFDATRGKLTPAQACVFPPGSGPRHLVMSPAGNRLYVACELDSRVKPCDFDSASGRITPGRARTTLPPGFAGANSAAGIVLSRTGDRLWVSNRGHDSVALFPVDPASGELGAPAWRIAGAKPRFLCAEPRGEGVLAANEDGDTIVAVGAGEPEVLARTGSPVCVVFAPEQP